MLTVGTVEPSEVGGVELLAAGTLDVVLVVAGTVLLVVLLVEVLLVATIAAGSAAGDGFCQTEREVGAPMLGKIVSRIAYTVPADANSTIAATTATTSGLANVERQVASPGPATLVGGGAVELTGASERPSPWPMSSQSSLTTSTLPVRGNDHHPTMVVVPASRRPAM